MLHGRRANSVHKFMIEQSDYRNVLNKVLKFKISPVFYGY